MQQVIKYIQFEVEQFRVLMFLPSHLVKYFLSVKLLLKISLGFKLTHKAHLWLLLHWSTKPLLFSLSASVNVNFHLLISLNIDRTFQH